MRLIVAFSETKTFIGFNGTADVGLGAPLITQTFAILEAVAIVYEKSRRILKQVQWKIKNAFSY